MRHDFFHTLRNLRQNPAFTATAILALALGMGANTAMFTVIRAVLLKPLAYPDPDRLVRISGAATSMRYESIRAAARSFTAVGAFRGSTENVTLSGGSEPEVLRQARVSANFLDILGARPALGRSFLPDEDTPGGAPVAMISAELWQRRFAGDPSAIGRIAILASAPCTVIGVLPPAFQFPSSGVDVWVTRPDYLMTPNSPLLEVFGRLKAGFSLGQASAEVSVLNRQYNAAHPGMLDRRRGATEQVTPFKDHLVAKARSMLWMLAGAVGFVLLVACSNVASLLLARAASRSREFALRAALGASRRRIIAQLLVESIVLAAAAGALGLVFADWSLAAIARTAALALPRSGEIRLDWAVFAFTSALSLLSAVLFGLAPSLSASRPDLAAILRATGESAGFSRSNRTFLGAIVVGQVALSVVLLTGAALLTESMARLGSVNPGFNFSHLLTMQLSLSPSRYDTEEKRAAFYDQLVRRVQLLPGVRGAALTLTVPLSGGYPLTPVQPAGQPLLKLNQRPLAAIQIVSPAWFRTLEIPIVGGREFSARDILGAPRVAIANRSLVRRLWPDGRNPIGQYMLIGASPEPVAIVGIAADSRQSLETDPAPGIFRPSAQAPPVSSALAVRTGGDPLLFSNAVRSEVRAIDGDQAVSNVRTMEDVLREEGSERRLVLRLLGLFAAMALLLTAVGIYGLVAWSVVERTSELGIRMALGAGRRDLFRLIIGRSLALTLAGVSIGIAGAATLSRVMGALLFQVSATDPKTLAAVATGFLLLALTASYIPARRATRILPMTALRC